MRAADSREEAEGGVLSTVLYESEDSEQVQEALF